MTATTAKLDDDWVEDLPVPPWVRPLSLEEQRALLKEAEDEYQRGEWVTNEEAMRQIDAMLARRRP